MLLVALLALVVAEVWVLVWVAGQIGVLAAVALLVIVSALGPWLVRRAGFGTWRRARARLDAGEVPGREVTNGLLLLGAGVLICVPGFITDAAGLLLLLPPVRFVVRRAVAARLTRWAALGRTPTIVARGGSFRRVGSFARGGRSRAGDSGVVDAGSHPPPAGSHPPPAGSHPPYPPGTPDPRRP